MNKIKRVEMAIELLLGTPVFNFWCRVSPKIGTGQKPLKGKGVMEKKGLPAIIDK